ncbi:MAG: DUF6798 domain-containing protein [Thermoguttaceae bacterium]
MNTPDSQLEPAAGKCLTAAEIALVFVIFFIQGAWPVPEVNEPYYLGKAIGFWNPDWVRGDFFLDSADSHMVFYLSFGWLSLWLSPPALAWFGRLLTWGLLAWSWRRLSFALLPRRWFSVLSAAVFVCLADRCHMAGEWVIGGLEAKGFAFVLVLLGIEALVRNRWNRAWLLLGAASAFHVLVGGWAVVAAALAWLLLACCRSDQPENQQPSLLSMWPGILGGFVLSLSGLLPAAVLNFGADAKHLALANHVYVFERLGHHLSPMQIPTPLVIRFAWVVVLAALLFWIAPARAGLRRLEAFVVGTILLALGGFMIGLLSWHAPELAAALLRFYWFRLADVIVPLGVAMVGSVCAAEALRHRPAVGKLWLAIGLSVVVLHVGGYAVHRMYLTPPRAHRMADYPAWRDICLQISEEEIIPRGARFLTPRMSQTFKWYTQHPEVVNWKEIPQDAEAIVEWWRQMEDIHATGSDDPYLRWRGSLAQLGPERLKQLGEKYQADYVLTVNRPRLPLPVVCINRRYVVYRLR